MSKTFLTTAFVLLLPLLAPIPARSTPDARDGPWLRIYGQRVQGVYIDARAADRPSVDAIRVELSPGPSQANGRRAALAVFSDDSILHEDGCLFTDLRSVDAGSASAACASAARALQQRDGKKHVANCLALEKDRGVAAIYVPRGQGGPSCLIAPDVDRDRVELRTGGVSVKSKLEIANRIPGSGGIRESEVMGQSAYMHVEGDRAFQCPTYGTPTTFRSKDMPSELAATTYAQLLERLPANRYDQAIRDPSQIFLERPNWQRQFLMRTAGFRYHCWNAHRVVDEPEKVAALLPDGTALLQGEVSVLRVRVVDGSTRADPARVRAADPAEVRELIARSGGRDCPDTCSFGGTRGSVKKPDALRFRQAIEGVDALLRDQYFQIK